MLEQFDRLPQEEREHFEAWIERATDDKHREIRISMLLDALKEK